MTILDRYGVPMQSVEKSSPLSQSLMAFSGGRRLFFETNTGSFYSKNSTVFKSIDFLSALGARLPFQIYRGDRLVDGGIFDNRFDLQYPNPDMSLNELMYQCLINYFYFGEAFIYNDLEFKVLTPLNPKSMIKYNGIWKYSNGSTNINISDDELIYIKRYNPDYVGDDNGDRGLSIVDVIKEDLINDLAAQRYNTKYFENYGKVGGFFNSDLPVPAAEFSRFKNDFENAHGGVNNAYKTLILPGGMKYQEANQTMREMEYIESRKDIRDKVLMALGIHKAVVGANETANRAVTEEAVRTIWLHTLQPVLTMFQEKFNQQLFRRYYPSYRMFWDYSTVPELKESMDTVLTQAERFRNLGYTLNEVNKYFDLGMDDVTDPIGDMRLIPSSLVPVDDLLMDEPIPEVPTVSGTGGKSYQALAKYFSNDAEETKSISTSKYIRNYNKLTRTFEKKFAGKVGKFFATELNKVIKYVYSQDTSKAVINETTLLLGILDVLAKNKSLLAEQLEPVYTEASLAADTLAVDTVQATAEPVASAVVVSSMTNKIKDISNHTYRMIRTQIHEGIELGESIDNIATRIKSVYKMSSSRSRIIARTETQAVVNRTTDERYKKEGVKKKKWVSTNDKLTRKTHAQNDKLGSVDYDYVYPNHQKFPGDGNGGGAENINCRCTIVPVI